MRLLSTLNCLPLQALLHVDLCFTAINDHDFTLVKLRTALGCWRMRRTCQWSKSVQKKLVVELRLATDRMTERYTQHP